MADEAQYAIRSDTDVVFVRQAGRKLAQELGFAGSDLILIATAISELARNILEYAKLGEVRLCPVERDGRQGLTVIAEDHGPGIPDVALAMQDGYSTSRSLGLGLPGTRRLMDEFTIDSRVGEGTIVTVTKWIT